MPRAGTTIFLGGALALFGYAVLNMGNTGGEPNKPPANASDEVTVTVKATFYGHGVFGQGKKAPFVTTSLDIITETEFPTGADYRRVYKKVKRGTKITVTVSPGEHFSAESRQGCSIFVDGVMRAGPPANDKGQAIASPEFTAGANAAVCNAVAS